MNPERIRDELRRGRSRQLTLLASAGGSRPTGRPRSFGLAMGGTALAGAASAIHYLWDMIRNQKRACPYCIAGAMLYLALVPLAIPGALAALEKQAPWRCPDGLTLP